MSRISHSKRVVGNIFNNHTACSYHTTIAYLNARTYNHTGSKPAIFAYSYRVATLLGLAAFNVVHRMIGGHQTASGANLSVVANSDEPSVEHDASVIHEHVFAQTDAMSVVAMERRIDERRLRDAWYEFVYQAAIVGVGDSEALKLSTKLVRPHHTRLHFGVAVGVELLTTHLFKFCHKSISYYISVRIYI